MGPVCSCSSEKLSRHLPVEVVPFQSYEMQVAALLAGTADPMPRIDIAWNINLAYLQADSWSMISSSCRRAVC
jgi:hypothetical protein